MTDTPVFCGARVQHHDEAVPRSDIVLAALGQVLGDGALQKYWHQLL